MFNPIWTKVPILTRQIFQTACSTTMQLDIMDASCQWKMKVDRDPGDDWYPGWGFHPQTRYTPPAPETNIASENRPSPKKVHLPTIDFHGLC